MGRQVHADVLIRDPGGSTAPGRAREHPFRATAVIVADALLGGARTTAALKQAGYQVKYVQMELARGALPGGKRCIGEEPLLARRTPQVALSKTETYGMGLMVDTEWGIPVIHHGGDLVGYHSDMVWLPDHGVGAVILTNSDDGGPVACGLFPSRASCSTGRRSRLGAGVTTLPRRGRGDVPVWRSDGRQRASRRRGFMRLARGARPARPLLPRAGMKIDATCSGTTCLARSPADRQRTRRVRRCSTSRRGHANVVPSAQRGT